MERRLLNAHCHNPLSFNNNIFSSRCSMSSFYNPSKLMQPPPQKYNAVAAPSSSSASVGGGGLNYIEHNVNKFDTLAGLAIKYGVEVAEIKKLNGLVTDHQMFARKTLNIPSDGRLPPISDAPDNQGPNSSEQTPSKQSMSVNFDSFKLGSSALPSVAPAMTAKQGYFGLEPILEKARSEELEMSGYLKREAQYPEDGTSVPLSLHRKSKSVAYDLYAKNLAQNVEAEAPEMLLKEEVISGGGFSALGGKGSKGLALRTKSVSRTLPGVDSEGGFPTALGSSAQAKIPSGVRRSCSTPSFQDAENGTSSSSSSSSWWNLKPDLQALSTSSVTKPILDGLVIPIAGKKSKAALD